MEDSLVVAKNWRGEGRGRWVWLQKSNWSDPCGDGTVLCLDCGGGYMNLHGRLKLYVN